MHVHVMFIVSQFRRLMKLECSLYWPKMLESLRLGLRCTLELLLVYHQVSFLYFHLCVSQNPNTRPINQLIK